MSLYTSTQAFIRFGLWFYYRKITIHHMENFPLKGPVLLVSNHPNSFMDALVIGAYLPRPSSFLARGDAFKNPILAKVFKTYHMLPVYRISEGKENIEKNFETFDVSYDEVNNGGSMLIFAEGLCKNNWDLRPLKKGPARIANRAWTGNDAAKDLVIIPIGLTYEHFDGGGKSVVINYGKPITKHDMATSIGAPNFVQQMNDKIATELEKLAYINNKLQPGTAQHNAMMQVWQQTEQKGGDVLETLKQTQLTPSTHSTKRSITKLHYSIIMLPHYWVMKGIAKKLTKGSVFYDSILFGFTLFSMPLYWLMLLIVIIWIL
jgi:1-acyl-sn-glycerol-3-phosphate acyltransferase